MRVFSASTAAVHTRLKRRPGDAEGWLISLPGSCQSSHRDWGWQKGELDLGRWKEAIAARHLKTVMIPQSGVRMMSGTAILLGWNEKRKGTDSGSPRCAVTQGCRGDRRLGCLLQGRWRTRESSELHAACQQLSAGRPGLSEEEAAQVWARPCPSAPASGQAVPSNLELQHVRFTSQSISSSCATAENRSAGRKEPSSSHSTYLSLPFMIVLGRFPSRPFVVVVVVLKK